jgi:hypothetical protein
MTELAATPVASGRTLPPWLRTGGALVLAGIFLALAPRLPQPLRAASAPVSLLAPGAAIVAVLFGARHRIDLVTRVALSVILSLAAIALVTVIADPLVARLDGDTFGLAVGGTVVVLGLVAGAQRGRGGAGDPGRAAPEVRRALLGFGCLAAAVGGATAAAVTLLPAPAPIPYFRFALDGEWSDLSSTVAPAGNRLAVPLSLRNVYPDARTYTIVPRLAGAQRWPRTTIRVGAGQTWRGAVAGPVPRNRRCFNRMSVALRDGGAAGHVAVLTFYVRGTRAFCPDLPVTRR